MNSFKRRTLVGSRYSWWSGNARFIKLSGKFLGAHVVHTAVIILWAGSMALFELSHQVPEKPLYDEGCVVLPHLASLALSIGPGGEITVLYSYFVISALHLICAGILGAAGIYHAIFGAERLEETTDGFLFGYESQDRFRITAILGAHLLTLGFGCGLLFVKAVYLGGVYDTWGCGGGDIRLLRAAPACLNPYVVGTYLSRPPFGSTAWIISMSNMEDLIGGHYWRAFYLMIGGVWHIQTRAFGITPRGFTWSAEAYLSYTLLGIALCGSISALYSWYNNTAYPSEFYGPTGPEASQAQSFTFLVRDWKMGLRVASAEGPTALGKYLMRSPTGEIIFGGESMRFYSMQAHWLEALRTSFGLDIYKIQSDIQTWQERRGAEYMTHAPLGSLNSVGGVATEINSINYVSPRSWLTCWHWTLGYFILVGHWWHGGRARASALSSEGGLSRIYEPVLYMRPID